MGKYTGSCGLVPKRCPRALIELACTTRRTPSSSATRKTLKVPAASMRKISSGLAQAGEARAARWTMVAQPRALASRSL